MENLIALDTTTEGMSFPDFLDQIELRPPAFISGGIGGSAKDKDNPPVPLEEGKAEGCKSLASKSHASENDSFEPTNERNLPESFLKKADTKSAEPKKESLPDEQDSPFMNSFLIELVHSIKNTLASIYHTTLLTMEKADDAEIRKHSHKDKRGH